MAHKKQVSTPVMVYIGLVQSFTGFIQFPQNPSVSQLVAVSDSRSGIEFRGRTRAMTADVSRDRIMLWGTSVAMPHRKISSYPLVPPLHSHNLY